MRDVTRDRKYNASNAIPFAFDEGNWVKKTRGDYVFYGIVISVMRKRSGSPRYAVENEDGIVHIFSHGQLDLDEDRQ